MSLTKLSWDEFDEKETVGHKKAMDKVLHQRKYQPFKTDIIWVNVGYLFLLHLGAVYALTLFPHVRIWTLLWVVFLYQLSMLGVTAGAHRLWTHRSYKAKLPLRIFLMLCNTVAGQNSIFDWSRKHRTHHKFSETDADPHNSNRGFFFCHIGWLMLRQHPDVTKKGKSIDMSDVLADPVVTFQKRNMPVLMLLFHLLLPTIVPILWGEKILYAYFIAFMLRVVLVLNITWSVNSIAHMYGNRPYDINLRPAENPIVCLFSGGEGYHNYHHAFPFDYRAGEFGGKLNLTTLYLDMFAKIGQAYDFKVASKDMVYKTTTKNGCPGSEKIQLAQVKPMTFVKTYQILAPVDIQRIAIIAIVDFKPLEVLVTIDIRT